jgi:hypothetical protein
MLLKQAPIMKRHILDFIIVGAGGFWSYFEEGEGSDYSLGALG